MFAVGEETLALSAETLLDASRTRKASNLISLWAKLQRGDEGIAAWHSLVGHSADVAAVVEALLQIPTLQQRLATTAGWRELDPVTITRLAALSFLHDIGKANRGFQARLELGALPVGHIDQLAWVFHGEGPAA
ncbi:hypothetical protein DK389_08130 [Methylobacterium durans]|uniref:HD Cas3-type domain-containing protein n=1 Tax=Methylobacterium durans TaxID=2202825 RepID=A0A2U8W340_9HYPH|nr:hypothetical protein DK389_08130 [Methylobacterium durans]